ncbi:MAG: hypothetical protein AMS14_02840 [Planctomycetes bacterium DG_20]|nr:MAG: hypothetical protein AMS14_02840 [Planctomycetes bacterium DG_20]
MAWIEMDWRPDRRHLRRFGAAALVALAAVGAWVFFRQSLFGFALGPHAANLTACILGGAAALCGVLTAAAPSALRPLYLGLSLVGLPIGLVVSHVVAGVVFYLVVTPIGLAMRLLGRDPLHRGFEPDAETYWVRREEQGEEAGRCFRQF